MGVIREIIKANAEERLIDEYVSAGNFIIYGTKGKSTLVASLSEVGENGVVVEFTPAGGSTNLVSEYPNFISIPVRDLKHLKLLLDDLKTDFILMSRLKELADELKANPTSETALANLAKGKAKLLEEGEDFDKLYDYAKRGKYYINAVCLAECNVISNWIMDEVETMTKQEIIGSDKKLTGMDWNLLKRINAEIYQKVLMLPCTTILSTSEILPTERQRRSQTEPNFGVGAFGRTLIDMVGNVFFSTYEDEKYMVYINGDDSDVLTKQKFAPVKIKSKLSKKIDVSNNPKKLWDYIAEIREVNKN